MFVGYKFKQTESKEYNIPSTKEPSQHIKFPSMNGWSANDVNFYKRHNLEPPIDVRSQSRRYRDALQTRMTKKGNSKDKGYSRG